MANSASDARHSEADIRQTLIEHNLIYGMLTLPSNMFYTVTLPATLWFFDKDKTDERILFIDARNIFTQIDRAHREFTEEQIQNIAIISRLHKGRRDEFLALIDRYFAAGMERLAENKTQVEPVSEKILEVLDDKAGKEAVASLVKTWEDLAPLEKAYAYSLPRRGPAMRPRRRNREEQRPAGTPRHLRSLLHPTARLPQADRQGRAPPRKSPRGEGQGSGQTPDRRPRHQAAQDRPRSPACRGEERRELLRPHPLATGALPRGEIRRRHRPLQTGRPGRDKEQDYSLNPGRYVGVVIEEDGKTEEEFIDDLLALRLELDRLLGHAAQSGCA